MALRLLLVFVLGCSTDVAELRVDLKTDLVPAREWSEVTVTLTDARGEVFEVSEDARASEDYLRGSRIASFEGIAGGAATLRVELATLAGSSVQFVRARIDGATGITILVPRSCADVECDAALGVCRDARCVSTDCAPENIEACPAPECTADTECVTAACAIGRCIEGLCLAEDRGTCECDPTSGCIAPAAIETEYTTSIGAVPTLVLPPTIRNETLAPIVLFLHGWGARNTVAGADLATFRDQDGVRTLVDRGHPAFADFPFLLVAPRCNSTQMDCWRWSPSDAIIDLVDMAAAEHDGDPARVYVTGLSTGGGGTWRMIAEHPDRVHAAVPIATVEALDVETPLGMPSCAGMGVPTWTFHSMNDTLQVPAFSEALVSAHASCEPEVQLSLGDWVNGGNDHTGWVEVYTNAHGFTFGGETSIWSWFLAR